MVAERAAEAARRREPSGSPKWRAVEFPRLPAAVAELRLPPRARELLASTLRPAESLWRPARLAAEWPKRKALARLWAA